MSGTVVRAINLAVLPLLIFPLTWSSAVTILERFRPRLGEQVLGKSCTGANPPTAMVHPAGAGGLGERGAALPWCWCCGGQGAGLSGQQDAAGSLKAFIHCFFSQSSYCPLRGPCDPQENHVRCP